MSGYLQQLIQNIIPWLLAHGLEILVIFSAAYFVKKVSGKFVERVIRKVKPFIRKAPQFLRVDDFADSAIIIKILGDTEPLKQWDVAGELRKRLKIAFDKEGIIIPSPQRVMHQARD